MLEYRFDFGGINMSKPFFKPWKTQHFNGTLILCESCPKGCETTGKTGWKDHPDSEWPYNFIVKHVEVKSEQDDDTFRILRLSFLYDGKKLEAPEFWQRHAFTNLVPRLMNRNPDKTFEKPNSEDKRLVREQFPLIVEYVKPQRILIASNWGVEILKELYDDKKYHYPFKSRDIWEMRYKSIPIVGIYHPKYWGFSPDHAIKATERLWNISQKSK